MSSRIEIQPQDQSSPPAKKARIESPSGVVDTPNNAASTSNKVSLKNLKRWSCIEGGEPEIRGVDCNDVTSGKE